jgi:hypothetical protein
MDHLFTANIAVNGREVTYDVRLENDFAFFKDEGKNAELREFGFRREGEDWKELQPLDERVKFQALTALEKYLLSQH